MLRSRRPAAQQTFRKQNAERFIACLGVSDILRLLRLSLLHGDVVVKTHTAPTRLVRLIINVGVGRAYYSLAIPETQCFPRSTMQQMHERKRRRRRPISISRASIHAKICIRRYCERSEYFAAGSALVKCCSYVMKTCCQHPNKNSTKLSNGSAATPTKRISRQSLLILRNGKLRRDISTRVLTRFSSELNANEIREVEVHLCDCIREMNYPFSQLSGEA